MQFDWPVQVYWEDTDAGGVVYHSQYLNFMERARTEWLRHLGFIQTQMRETLGVLFVVRHIDMNYKKPAKFDDALIVRTCLINQGRSFITFEQSILRSDEMLTSATVKVVCIDAEKFKPVSIPKLMLQRFEC
jgi:acyl-CoA thioester hydrolase